MSTIQDVTDLHAEMKELHETLPPLVRDVFAAGVNAGWRYAMLGSQSGIEAAGPGALFEGSLLAQSFARSATDGPFA